MIITHYSLNSMIILRGEAMIFGKKENNIQVSILQKSKPRKHTTCRGCHVTVDSFLALTGRIYNAEN
jgi:hypothetical protein